MELKFNGDLSVLGVGGCATLMYGGFSPYDVKLLVDRVVVKSRKPSNCSYGNGKHVPDEIKQEVFVIKDGELILDDSLTVHGRMQPSYIVEEKEEWNDVGRK